MENLKNINANFEEFVKNIKEVRKNVDEENEYTRGYLDCMKEVIEGSLSENTPAWMENLEKNRDMKIRGEVVDEILIGLEALLEMYKKQQSE